MLAIKLLHFTSTCTLQVSLAFDTDDDARVLLLVHDTKPPFLEGKVREWGWLKCSGSNYRHMRDGGQQQE